MQFTLTFHADDLTIPMAYQYQVQSMIYALLRRDSALGSRLHPGAVHSGKATVPFCLGSLNGEKTVLRSEKKLRFRGEISLELRTADAALSGLLCALLRPGLEIKLFDQTLTLAGVEANQITLPGNQYRIRMLSPLLVFSRTAGGKTVYHAPLDPEFAPLLLANAQRKYLEQRGKQMGALSIAALSVGARDKVVTQYKGTWMTGWKGAYLLRGAPEALSFLYDAGLGQRNAAGFGMFEIVEDGR